MQAWYSEVGEYKIFEIGGVVVKGWGYFWIPPAINAISQPPPPHPQKIKVSLRSTLILKKASFGCGRTTATHVDTPNACVHLIVA